MKVASGVDTVKAFGITLTAVHAFNGDQFYSIRESKIKTTSPKEQGEIRASLSHQLRRVGG